MSQHRHSGLFAVLLVVTAAGLFVCRAEAQTFQVTQITNNNINDYLPIIQGNDILWEGHDGNDGEIFHYNGVTTTQITDNDFDDEGPSFYGDDILWSSWEDDIELFLYDGVTTTQLTNNTFSDERPWASGNNIVWMGYAGFRGFDYIGHQWDLFHYDGVTTTQFNVYLDGARSPIPSGNNILWQGSDGDDDEIFLHEITTGTTTQLSDNSFGDYSPVISGDRVAWEGYHDDNDFEIFIFDGATTTQLTDNDAYDGRPRFVGDNLIWQSDVSGSWEILLYDGITTTQLTSGETSNKTYPRASGNNLVWEGWDGNDFELFLFDGSTTTQITDNTSDDKLSSVRGNNILWRRHDGNDNEIFHYNIAADVTTQLTDNNFDERYPKSSGNNIVWDGYDGNDWEIFMATSTYCAPGDTNCDSFVDIDGDILSAFSNYTGPGSFGKTRAEGDVQGDLVGTPTTNVPADGDVDVSDLLVMFANFTGPELDSGASGLTAAEAGDANVPDLVYDPNTGEVILDVDGAGIIGYVLKNGTSDFVFGSHAQILAGVKTSVLNELSEAAFASSVGANSLGNVFPTGMNLAALSAYLTVNQVSTSLGAPVVPFDLVVLGGAVPEPSTCAMAVLGLLGMAMLGYRRRRPAT